MKTTESGAHLTEYETFVYATAPTAFIAYEAVLDAITKAGGDWEMSKPYDVGILNGAIVTGKGIEARRVRK